MKMNGSGGRCNKTRTRVNGCFKAPYSVDSSGGGGAANESFIHSAQLLSCGAILRGVILIYCLSQFGFFMSAQFCSTGESSKIEKKTSLTEF